MHACVVVLLDKARNSLRDRMLRGFARAGGGTGGGGVDGGDHIGAEVGQEVEGRVDGKREEGEPDGLGVEPDKSHDCPIISKMNKTSEIISLTQVLDILITKESEGVLLGSASSALGSTTAVGLVYDDSVGDGSRNEGKAIAQLGHDTGRVEADHTKGVAEGCEQKTQVPTIQIRLAFAHNSN